VEIFERKLIFERKTFRAKMKNYSKDCSHQIEGGTISQ
jgi:hypothetical protein